MTLNQLEYFCAVCRYHSITRASSELFVSAPTISVALKKLEDEFHLRLFIHGKNQITLTPEGEAFYKRATFILNNCYDLRTEFAMTAGAKKPLKIGIPPMLSTVYFPSLMTRFQELYDIPIQLYSYGSIRACNLVDTKELDIALANLDFYNVDRFNYHVISEESYVFCVSRKSPLAREEALTLEMIGDTPLIFYDRDSVQNQTMFFRYNAADITPNILMYSSQLSTTCAFVRENLAGAFLYESIGIDDEDIVRIPITPAITSKIGLVWKKEDVIEESVQRFIRFIKEA